MAQKIRLDIETKRKEDHDMSLVKYLKEVGTDPKLLKLINRAASACLEIGDEIRDSEGVYAKSNSQNKYGDNQYNIDIAANERLMTYLKSKYVYEIASEESNNIETVNKDGTYSISLDPIDGSSLLDSNMAIGTIVGFYSGPLLTHGKSRIEAAFYVLYGPKTTLVYADKNYAKEFVLHQFGDCEDPHFEFKEASNKYITMPSKSKIIGIGGSTTKLAIQKVMHDMKLKLRYSGCLVADFNNIIHNGGILGHQECKLRKLFELNPMSLIMEACGGASLHCYSPDRILDWPDDDLHSKLPFVMGPQEDIRKLYQTS
jgi:fructose-1,6-bisphosphatase I